MFTKMKRNLFKYFGKKKDQPQEEIIKPKEVDPKGRLKKKLQLIARNTKSARIRKKNLKRLVNLFSDY